MNLKNSIKTFIVTIIVIILTMCFAGAEWEEDDYCEVNGHNISFFWDDFWEVYDEDDVPSVGAVCMECESTFYIDVDVNKKVKKATFSSDGYTEYIAVASFEGQTYTDYGTTDIIDKLSSCTFASSTYNYTGSAIKPSVIVKNEKGERIPSNNYTVTYSNNKNVGKASAKIKMCGKYSGEKTLSFTIAPKKASISSITTKPTSATVKWSKIATQVDSLKLQYSTDKNFSNGVKSISIKDLSVTSKTISGLSVGKTYYFRIISYKKVSDKTYSAVSAVKSVKTPAYITLSKTSMTMYKGKSTTLTATSYKGTPSWKSSDSKVVKVSSKGVVTAVAKGSATITAYVKSGDTTYKATCKVTVNNPSIKLDKTSATIYAGKVKKVFKGGSVTLKATTNPSSVTVTWTSSNTAVASVSSAGKVTAKKAGTAKITAKFTYAGYSYLKTCTVTVKNKAGITLKSVYDLDEESFYDTVVCYEFVNNTNTTIDSIKFESYLLDDEEYIVYIDGFRGQNLIYTQDIEPGETITVFSKPMYSGYEAVHAIAVNRIIITYSDGSTETINHNTSYWDECCHSKVTH